MKMCIRDHTTTALVASTLFFMSWFEDPWPDNNIRLMN